MYIFGRMTSNFVQINFFWIELEFFKNKSHISVNFQKKSDFLHDTSFFYLPDLFLASNHDSYHTVVSCNESEV